MGMRIGTKMPRLEGATEWFGGTQAHAEAEARGHPTLVHFWSLSCGMCKENLPRVAEWRDGLKEQGLRVLVERLSQIVQQSHNQSRIRLNWGWRVRRWQLQES